VPLFGGETPWLGKESPGSRLFHQGKAASRKMASTSTKSIAQPTGVKQYPLKGRGGLTVPGSTRAIGEDSSIPFRGYSVTGADSQSQEPWVGQGGDCHPYSLDNCDQVRKNRGLSPEKIAKGLSLIHI